MLSMTEATFPDWREEPRNGREQSDWVMLRVGGQVFETTRQTLYVDQESMLAAQVLRHSGEDENNNSNSIIRFDRDGQRFAHVLNYLRNGTVWVQDAGLLRELQEEADFFCLAGLRALCDQKIQQIEEAQVATSRANIEILKEEVMQWLGEVFSVLRPPPRPGLPGGGEQEPEFRLDVDF